MTRLYRCGHPNTVENTVSNGAMGSGRCKQCHKDSNHKRWLAVRPNTLPAQIAKARAKLQALEAEARLHGLHDLVEPRA